MLWCGYNHAKFRCYNIYSSDEDQEGTVTISQQPRVTKCASGMGHSEF